MNRIYRKTLTERLVAKVGKRYEEFWDRRERKRQISEMFSDLMLQRAVDSFISHRWSEEKIRNFRSAPIGAPIGGSEIVTE